MYDVTVGSWCFSFTYIKYGNFIEFPFRKISAPGNYVKLRYFYAVLDLCIRVFSAIPRFIKNIYDRKCGNRILFAKLLSLELSILDP